MGWLTAGSSQPRSLGIGKLPANAVIVLDQAADAAEEARRGSERGDDRLAKLEQANQRLRERLRHPRTHQPEPGKEKPS